MLLSATYVHEAKAVDGQSRCVGHYVRPEVKRGCINPLFEDSAYCQDCYTYLKHEHERNRSDAELRTIAEDAIRRGHRGAYTFKQRLRQYGITEDQYHRAVERQHSRCGVCGMAMGRFDFCIDHDHKCCPRAKACGSCFRGLLCGDCNKHLGVIEKPGFLPKALRYLGADEKNIVGEM